jgi:hypothetical protein
LGQTARQRVREIRDGVFNVGVWQVAQDLNEERRKSTNTYIVIYRQHGYRFQKNNYTPEPTSKTFSGRFLPKLDEETSDLNVFAASWLMLVNILFCR